MLPDSANPKTEEAVSHSTATAKARQRLHWLDGIRILLAVWVVGHHAVDWNFKATGFLWFLSEAHFAVTAFIVVSGFSLMYTVVTHGDTLRGGVKGFFWRRCRRILPPYWAALVLALWTTHFCHIPVSHSDLLPHFLLMHDWIRNPYAYSPPFWSIATEEHIYWLFPLILVAWGRYGWARTVAVATALSWLGQIAIARFGLAPPAFYYFGPFCFGAAAAWLWAHGRSPAGWMRTLAVVALLGVIPLEDVLGGNWLIPADNLFALAFAVVLWSFVCGNFRIAGSVLGWKPLAWGGTWSYSLYLAHYSILMIVHRLLDSMSGNPPGRGMIYVPIAIAASWLWSLPFERPFLSGKRDPVFDDRVGPVLTSFPIVRASAFFVVLCLSMIAATQWRIDPSIYLVATPLVGLLTAYIAWRTRIPGALCLLLLPISFGPVVNLFWPDDATAQWVGIGVSGFLAVRWRDWRPILLWLACWGAALYALVPGILLCSHPLPFRLEPKREPVGPMSESPDAELAPR